MPEEVVPDLVATEAVAAPAPAPALAEQITTASAGVPAAVPATEPAVAAAAPEWQGVREFATANGVDLPFADDTQALQALLRSHQASQERNYYADVGRRFAPHANELAEFLKARQVQANAPQAPPAWQGPEFKKEWLSLVEKDPNTGQLRSKPGYDPAIAEKVTAYAEWREGFLESPEKVVGPLIAEQARQLIDQRFAEQSERQTADALVARNAAWMFAADPQGQPVFTPQGQRQLTPEGVMYARAADHLWKIGLRDVRAIDAFSRGQVENAVMRQKLLALQPAAPAASVAAATLGAEPSVAAPAVPASQKGLSLQQRLMVNLRGAPENITL